MTTQLLIDTAKARRAYRQMIVTTPGLGESISGAILYDETIYQKTKEMAGHPGEKITAIGL